MLSARLHAIAAMVTPGNTVCDIGCDRALVVIDLIGRGVVPRAIVMDINSAPLEGAREEIKGAGLEDRIDIRLSDGLTALGQGETYTVILTGMGGPLIQTILIAGAAKTDDLRELILGPQSDVPALRRSLRQRGFVTVAEDMVFEEDKFYPLIKVRPGPPDPAEKPETTLYDCYGPILLRDRHPALLAYLKRERDEKRKIINEINDNTSYLTTRAQDRLEELLRKVEELQDLIRMW